MWVCKMLGAARGVDNRGVMLPSWLVHCAVGNAVIMRKCRGVEGMGVLAGACGPVPYGVYQLKSS